MNKLFLLFLMLFSTVLWGQEESNVSTIYLNNGEVYKGNLVDYRKGEFLVIKRLNGDLDTIADNNIKRIEQFEKTSPSDQRPYKQQYAPPPPVRKEKKKKKRKYLF
ncbi:MAG: hypothetical protein DWQ02_27170, partial [Bacteroidetes bacterium]